jgi:hypothetical protein
MAGDFFFDLSPIFFTERRFYFLQNVPSLPSLLRLSRRARLLSLSFSLSLSRIHTYTHTDTQTARLTTTPMTHHAHAAWVGRTCAVQLQRNQPRRLLRRLVPHRRHQRLLRQLLLHAPPQLQRQLLALSLHPRVLAPLANTSFMKTLPKPFAKNKKSCTQLMHTVDAHS